MMLTSPSALEALGRGATGGRRRRPGSSRASRRMSAAPWSAASSAITFPLRPARGEPSPRGDYERAKSLSSAAVEGRGARFAAWQ
jgi:hypothetical protein